jgi:hypothetical protein
MLEFNIMYSLHKKLLLNEQWFVWLCKWVLPLNHKQYMRSDILTPIRILQQW